MKKSKKYKTMVNLSIVMIAIGFIELGIFISCMMYDFYTTNDSNRVYKKPDVYCDYNVYIGDYVARYSIEGSYNIVVVDSASYELQHINDSYLFIVDFDCKYLHNRPELKGYLKAISHFTHIKCPKYRKQIAIDIGKIIRDSSEVTPDSELVDVKESYPIGVDAKAIPVSHNTPQHVDVDTVYNTQSGTCVTMYGKICPIDTSIAFDVNVSR